VSPLEKEKKNGNLMTQMQTQIGKHKLFMQKYNTEAKRTSEVAIKLEREKGRRVQHCA
jgi:hypothetical protein